MAHIDLRKALELVQLDRPGAARAIALRMRCLAHEAKLAGEHRVLDQATVGALAAESWQADDEVEEARVQVLRSLLRIASQLGIALY